MEDGGWRVVDEGGGSEYPGWSQLTDKRCNIAGICEMAPRNELEYSNTREVAATSIQSSHY